MLIVFIIIQLTFEVLWLRSYSIVANGTSLFGGTSRENKDDKTTIRGEVLRVGTEYEYRMGTRQLLRHSIELMTKLVSHFYA